MDRRYGVIRLTTASPAVTGTMVAYGEHSCQLSGANLRGWRQCAGGAGATRTDNDYALFLHQRSRQVSEGRDDLSVIPMGYHESMHNPALEVDPAFSVFRELYEELFGGREEVRGKAFARPRFFYRGNPPLEWLRANSASFELVLTAFGINLLQGNYEFASLLSKTGFDGSG